uniref:uncharacterized protein LOC122601316 n=1 Tax=Erigeron canadensis TaxID=72917 RepID=UPI001CB8FF81|nr:uncharacterized protein LOC122601316 [Erigeron canadensis]
MAFPVVANYVKNAWAKFGLQKIMMNANGFFFFKFENNDGIKAVHEGGPWLVRNAPIFLNVWTPSAILKKEDVKMVAVWVKIHNVPMAAYTDDGLSLLATKIGTPKMLDSYTTNMCLDSWGRSSFARAFVEISAEKDFKDELSIAIPTLEGEGYTKETMKVEYEWKPPRCKNCSVFGHDDLTCPKYIKAGTNATTRVDKDGFEEVRRKGKAKTGFNVNKQKPKFEYRPIAKPSASTSTTTKPVTTKNQFEALADHGKEPVTELVHDNVKTGRSSTLSKGYETEESDEEEVIEVYNKMDEYMKSQTESKPNSEGASTPGSKGANG